MEKREIKFRAWDLQMRTMHDIDILVPLKNGTYKALWGDKSMIELETIWQALPMQFTGMYDAASRPIFEGDIIESLSSKGEAVRHFVYYEPTVASFRLMLIPEVLLGAEGPLKKDWIEEFGKKVVGNIYEHAHLLSDTP